MAERNWEPIEKCRAGGYSRYGNGWGTHPAMGVNKTGFSFNAPFVAAFVKKFPSAALFAVDREQRIIGIKIVDENDPAFLEGYILTTTQKRKGGGRSDDKPRVVYVTCKALSELFFDAQGCAYRAFRTPGNGLIEVEISPSNMVR